MTETAPDAHSPQGGSAETQAFMQRTTRFLEELPGDEVGAVLGALRPVLEAQHARAAQFAQTRARSLNALLAWADAQR